MNKAFFTIEKMKSLDPVGLPVHGVRITQQTIDSVGNCQRDLVEIFCLTDIDTDAMLETLKWDATSIHGSNRQVPAVIKKCKRCGRVMNENLHEDFCSIRCYVLDERENSADDTEDSDERAENLRRSLGLHNA